MQPSSPPNKEYRKELIDYRSWLFQVDYQTSNEQDKLLTTLSAGALSVSVGFFRDVTDLSIASQYTLIWSWILFAMTLVVALLAFRPTREMLKEEIARKDVLLAGKTEPSDERVVQAQQRAKKLNLVAVCLFVGGMILQLLFLGMRLFR
jgi:hypothetical protein